MQVFIYWNQIYLLEVNDSTFISELKKMIKKKSKVNDDDIFLTHAGKILQDDMALSDYLISENSSIHVNNRLR
jgi:hypothetical protein